MALCVLQSNFYPGHSNPADGSTTTTGAILCISSSTLDRIRPVATAAGVLMGGGEPGGGKPPRPQIARRQPVKGPFYGNKKRGWYFNTNRA